MPPLDWSEVGMSGPVPTGTVTLLLADAEGSTKLWETAPDQMAAAFANLDCTLADLASVHHGVRPVEQGEGDSFVVAFTRASDAVACALALQQAPLAPIKLRIGLHTGEVRRRDEGNYIGPAINRTARLRELAHGGQTVLSGTTSDLVADLALRPAVQGWAGAARLVELGRRKLTDPSCPASRFLWCGPSPGRSGAFCDRDTGAAVAATSELFYTAGGTQPRRYQLHGSRRIRVLTLL